jgi:hypothetical protein
MLSPDSPTLLVGLDAGILLIWLTVLLSRFGVLVIYHTKAITVPDHKSLI